MKSQRLYVQAEGTISVKAQKVEKKKKRTLMHLRKLRITSPNHVGEESESGACDPVSHRQCSQRSDLRPVLGGLVKCGLY